MAEYDVAVVDAGGAVGEVIIELLEQRRFPVRTLYPLSTAEAGDKLGFAGKRVLVRDPEGFDFAQVDLVFFAGSAAQTAALVPAALAAGCRVVDASGHGRGSREARVVVPEVNPPSEANDGYYACPTPASVPLILALQPIAELGGLERVSVATYQAVSSAGADGVKELAAQTAQLLNARQARNRVFAKQIAFNCLPQIGELDAQGVSAEERAIVEDVRGVLDLRDLSLAVTAVQVPVFFGHGLVVHLQTRRPVALAEVRRALAAAPGVELIEGEESGSYPTPVSEAANHDQVFVGRLREDVGQPQGLNFWVVADNVRKSAALNSIQIAECLTGDPL